MKTSQIESVESGWERAEELVVRVARNADDWNLAKSALFEEHSLGAGAEAGDRLCQLIYEGEKLVQIEMMIILFYNYSKGSLTNRKQNNKFHKFDKLESRLLFSLKC